MEQINAGGTTITVIHFSYNNGSRECIACAPGMYELHATPFHPNFQRTNDPRSVSCNFCKMTPVFAQAASENAVRPSLPTVRDTTPAATPTNQPWRKDKDQGAK